jgi:hypothetical protein
VRSLRPDRRAFNSWKSWWCSAFSSKRRAQYALRRLTPQGRALTGALACWDAYLQHLRRMEMLRRYVERFLLRHLFGAFHMLAAEVVQFRGVDVGLLLIRTAKLSTESLAALVRMMPPSRLAEALVATDGDGGTALHWVARLGTRADAKLLVKHGADVHAKDATGGTPLHWAARRGNGDTAGLLFEVGANPFALNSMQKSAVDVARISGHMNLESLLTSDSRAHRLESVWETMHPSPRPRRGSGVRVPAWYLAALHSGRSPRPLPSPGGEIEAYSPPRPDPLRCDLPRQGGETKGASHPRAQPTRSPSRAPSAPKPPSATGLRGVGLASIAPAAPAPPPKVAPTVASSTSVAAAPEADDHRYQLPKWVVT